MRVLAVSAESSVAAALNMMDGWEVVFATDTDQAEAYARGAAVVIAGGGTKGGLALVEILRDRGLATPAVVLGDTPAPDDAQTTVVVPPFTLDELRSAVEGVVRGDAVVQRVAAPLPPAAPPRPAPEVIPELEPLVTLQPIEPLVSPVPVEVWAPAPEPIPGTLDVPEPLPPVEAEIKAVEEEVPLEPIDAPSTIVAEAASMPSSPAPAEPVADPWAAPTRQPVQVLEEEPTHRRWGRRKAHKETHDVVVATPASMETPMAERLRIAELAVRELEAVIHKLPVLADLEALAGALIGEVVERFTVEVASVYVPTEKGFRVAAGHGLTSTETRMVVPADQPLFAKIWSTREPHLIAPLDLARSMVHGIGGARTDAMIAGPVEAEGGLVGIIVIGGPDFADRDLDRLDELAREAAPGLSVALAIQRLRELT